MEVLKYQNVFLKMNDNAMVFYALQLSILLTVMYSTIKQFYPVKNNENGKLANVKNIGNIINIYFRNFRSFDTVHFLKVNSSINATLGWFNLNCDE